MSANNCDQWAAEVLDAVRAFELAADRLERLTEVPQGPGSLESLQHVWANLGGAEHVPTASHSMAENFAGRFRTAAERMRKAVGPLLARLNGALARGRECEVIVPAELGNAAGRYSPDIPVPERSFATVCIARLPQEHPLRLLLPADDLYQSGGAGHLILGRLVLAGQNFVPADYYLVSEAVRQTRAARAPQREAELAKKAQEESEHVWKAEQERWSPAGQLREAQKRIRELEQKFDGAGARQ
jgi:hypothetical protein